MTENELRNKVASCARSWLGRREADGSHKPIIDIYNSITPLPGGYRMTYTDPWCAAFVSAVGARCGLSNIILPECSCERMIQLYKKVGRWKESDSYVPKIADLIFYDWQDSGAGDNKGEADHVGIVADVTGGTFTVIEGNKSDAVGTRTMRVNGQYIRGFAVPDYASKATNEPEPAEDKPDEGTAVVIDHTDASDEVELAVTLPVIHYGMIGVWVTVMQTLLISKWFSCGWYGADGEYGEKTGEALKAFQKANKLTPDGICGRDTWAALLKT